MILLTQLKDPRWKPQDSHILKWPNGDTFWYDALMGQYCPCAPSIFDAAYGGDLWEIEEDACGASPLPWVL